MPFDFDLCRDVGQVTVLYSKQMILYTWDDPQGVRKLLWKPYKGKDKPIEAPVDKVTFCSTFPRKGQKRKRYFLFSSTIRLNERLQVTWDWRSRSYKYQIHRIAI